MYIFRDKEINCAKMNEEASEIDRVGLREMWAHLRLFKLIMWWC